MNETLTTAYPVPAWIEAELRRYMAGNERILWYAQPDPDEHREHTPSPIALALWMLPFLLVMAFVILVTQSAWLVLGMLLLLLVVLRFFEVDEWRPAHVHYIATHRQGFIVQRSFWGAVHTRIIQPQKITRVRMIEDDKKNLVTFIFYEGRRKRQFNGVPHAGVLEKIIQERWMPQERS